MENKRKLSDQHLQISVYAISSQNYYQKKPFRLSLESVFNKFVLTESKLQESSNSLLAFSKNSYLFHNASQIQVILDLQDEYLGYFRLPLQNFLKKMDADHEIEVRLGWVKKSDKGRQILKQKGEFASVFMNIRPYLKITGEYTIEVLDAVLQRNTESLGKMDPYVICKIDDVQKKTKVHNEGGKKPKWNQKLIFPFEKKVPSLIFIEVFDKDLTSDDLVGSGIISIHQDHFMTGYENADTVEIDLKYEQKVIGKIRLRAYLKLKI